MNIHTASYFHLRDHVGESFCISRTQPYLYPELVFLYPSSDLLYQYRHGIINWEQYSQEYNDLLELRSDLIEIELNQMEYDDITLCCWERKVDHCHRVLAAYFISNNFNFELGEIK